MAHRRCLLAALFTGAALAVSLAGPARADVAVTALDRETPVSAYAGHMAWSVHEAGRYRLALRDPDGRITIAGVPRRFGPFDVTLGPDADGRPVALYSRCATAAETRCDAYRYDLTSRTERRLGLSSPTADEAWPSQWGGRYAFVRRGTKTIHGVPERCDVPYTRLVAGGPSRRLDRGRCTFVTQQALRGTTVAQVAADFPGLRGGAGVKTSEIRVVRATGGPSRRLASQNFGEESNVFTGLAIDATHVFATRSGVNPTPSFVRIALRSGRREEVPARTGLAGPMARDGARVLYLETQGSFSGGTCSTNEPCRLVDTVTDPFGTASRALTPRLVLDAAAPDAQILATRPLVQTGSLTRAVVRRGVVIRTDPVGGTVVEVDRASYAGSPSDEAFRSTGQRATTGPDGRFTVTQPAPLPAFNRFRARTAGDGVVAISTGVGVATRAEMTLRSSSSRVGEVRFQGTVAPAQPGRSVQIQRLAGRPCETGVGGRQFCRDVYATAAEAPLSADGRSFAVTVRVDQAGEYTAALPFVRLDDPAAVRSYEGRSGVVQITD